MGQTDVQSRLMAALGDPEACNQTCSECDRPDNKPVGAAFFQCPVDQKILAVVCCKKCFKLIGKIDDPEVQFQLKSLTGDLKDWTDKDIDALESSGNRLVNTCWEATVTNEKDGRDRRKYGYEAYLFEKYVNMSYFDEILYGQEIAKASKALVEKRFNQNLRGFNLKKLGASSSKFDHDPADLLQDDNDDDSNSDSNRRGEKREELERSPSHRSVMRERRNVGQNRRRLSSRNLQLDGGGDLSDHQPRRRNLSSRNLMSGGLLDDHDNNNKQEQHRNRRRLSARNLMSSGEEEKKDDNAKRSQLSKQRMNSLRRDLGLEAGGSGDSTNTKRPSNVRDISGDDNSDHHGTMRRSMSQRRLANRRDNSDGGGLRRASSSNRLTQDGGSSGGMRRSGSHRALAPEGSGGLRRASSRNSLRADGDGDDRRSNRGGTAGGRHRLSKRNLLA